MPPPALAQQHYVALAKSLPPKLLRFLARYPPAAILSPSRPPPSPPPPPSTATVTATAAAAGAGAAEAAATTKTKSQKQQQNAHASPARKPPLPGAPAVPARGATGYQLDRADTGPFRFWKHPATGRWHDPVYSLRRQADLVKLARAYGVEELLPPSDRGTDSRLASRVERGLRVKGTGVGQRVKGHIYERMMVKKMSARRKAMLKMPFLVAKWRRRGPRRWGYFPKKPSPMA